jgi:AmiR/NasT family two-component response regulator
MSKPSPFSVRGRRALTLIKDAREIAVVRRQFERLGMTIFERDPHDVIASFDAVDVVILDADAIPLDRGARTWRIAAPIIALVGTETPSRLKSLLEIETASFLVKPLRSAGLYTALVFALHRAQRNEEIARRIQRLDERLRARRIVFAATIEIMRRYALPESEAFALIRRAAMINRKTIEQVSVEIVTFGSLPRSNTQTA